MAEVLQRVCFRLQVDPTRLDDYRSRHARVWPEMLHALRDSGWRNYSLFLDDDGTLIGYFETRSLVEAQERMGDTDVNAQWQAEMAEFFTGINHAPDQSFATLTEVFNLESQLHTAGGPAGPNTNEESL